MGGEALSFEATTPYNQKRLEVSICKQSRVVVRSAPGNVWLLAPLKLQTLSGLWASSTQLSDHTGIRDIFDPLKVLTQLFNSWVHVQNRALDTP